MKHIHIESAPWWYELTWEGSSRPCFVLRVETWAFVEVMKRIERSKSRGREPFEQVKPFARIGNEGAFFERSSSRPPGYVIFRFRPSSMRANGGYDWDRGAKVAQTMSDMLRMLSGVEGEPNDCGSQLLKLETYDTGRSMHRFPLSGYASSEFLAWAKSQGERRQEDVETAMYEAWVVMAGPERIQDFRAWTSGDGSFQMSVPGSCACLGVNRSSSRWTEPGQGYEFQSHNVDAPWQQLALLAGMAKMWRSAKKSAAQVMTAPGR